MERKQLINEAMAAVENGTLVKYTASMGDQSCSGVLTEFAPDFCEMSEEQITFFEGSHIFDIDLDGEISIEENVFHIMHPGYIVSLEF